MRFKSLVYIVFLLLVAVSVTAKEKEDRLAMITQNLHVSEYPLDPEASAVVLYEHTAIMLTFEEGSFNKKKVVHKIIKILKADAFDAANVHIIYPEDDYRNFVNNVKATTYNLAGDQVITTPVNKEDILKKAVGNDLHSINFTMPAVKEGSIIEYSYEVITKNLDALLTWQIQDEYPKLQSSYYFEYPKLLEFTAISHVPATPRLYKTEDDAREGTDIFATAKRSSIDGNRSFWIRRNIPGTKTELYVVNRKNHVECYQIQITGAGKGPDAEHFNNSWEKINEKIWKKDGIKKAINGNNIFLDPVIDSIAKQDTSPVSFTNAIYRFVRNRFKCNNKSISYSDINLSKAFYARELTMNEINMVLVAMLVKAGMAASPVIVSSTGDISPTAEIPVLDRIGTIVCAVEIGGKYTLLDASDKNNCVGLLPTEYYNGYSWLLADKGMGTMITTNNAKDKTLCNIKVSDFSDSGAKVEITTKLGLMRSAAKRKLWAVDKKKSKEYLAEVTRDFPDLEVLESNIYNEQNPDTNLVIKYTCRLNIDKAATQLYMPGIMIKLFDKNPFASTARKFPIEFPYQTEYAYYITIVLPADMQPDSAAKPVVIDYDNGGMSYKKQMGYFPEMHTVNVNSTFAINTTSYSVENYPLLREFFQKMIDDNNQVLVFSKIKK